MHDVYDDDNDDDDNDDAIDHYIDDDVPNLRMFVIMTLMVMLGIYSLYQYFTNIILHFIFKILGLTFFIYII